jgi:hypothetical protein
VGFGRSGSFNGLTYIIPRERQKDYRVDMGRIFLRGQTPSGRIDKGAQLFSPEHLIYTLRKMGPFHTSIHQKLHLSLGCYHGCNWKFVNKFRPALAPKSTQLGFELINPVF